MNEIKAYGQAKFDDGDLYGRYSSEYYFHIDDSVTTFVEVGFRSRPKYNNKFTMITEKNPSLIDIQKEAYEKFAIHTA